MTTPFSFSPSFNEPMNSFTPPIQLPGNLPLQNPVPGGLPQGGSNQGGQGFNWMQALMGAGQLASAGADIFGAYQQGKINDANFAAQFAQQQLMNKLIQGQMTPAGQQNPFSSAIMQFLGGQGGGNFTPQTQGPAGNTPQGSGGFQGLPPNPWMNSAAPSGFTAAPPNSMMNSIGQNGIPGATDTNPGSNLPMQPPNPISMGGMYQYQNSPAGHYNAAMLGQAPRVNAPQQAALSSFTASQSANVNPMQAAMAQSIAGYTPQQISNAPNAQMAQLNPVANASSSQAQMPGGISLPTVADPTAVSPQMVTGTQGANAGQDALLQMMRRDVSAPRDASIDPMLQSGTGSFNNSNQMSALANQDQMLLDEQVNQLRGSAGSFGQRFGSQMMKQEGNMRNQFATNIAARNANLQQQSYENAANRNLQGAGIEAGREQFFGSQGLQNAQLQQSAAQAAQQGGLQNNALSMQAQLANQQAGLQAQQFNVGAQQGAQQFNAQNAINASLATQGLQAQVGQTNAQLGTQTALANQSTAAQMAQLQAQLGTQNNQFNAGNQLQAMLANQQTGMQSGLANNQLAAQLGMFNAGNQQQASQFNLSNLLQNQQFNAGLDQQAGLQNQQLQQLLGSQNQNTSLQALLANQNLAGQYGLANQASQNQAGQFNANMLQNQNQFTAQQGNIYNQLMMSGMMNAAGLQNQQQSMNTSLLGILGGVGVPQQQVNPMYGAIGDSASQLSMMPMLMQMMNQQGRR